ncbi:MAG: hypothetical protein ACXVRS_17475 [Gaiellaceae bacterium]
MSGATHSVDLSNGRIDGRLVLGRTVAGVTAALGRPDFRSGPKGSYVVGWGSRPNFSFEVIFRPTGGVERAWSIAFERGPVFDVKIGDLLNRSPTALESLVRARYAGTLRLVHPYACTKSICSGEFASRTGSLHVTFGKRPTLGTWLTVWKAPA